ncbi:hypothetical protein BDW72DRAFT_214175 [Aspergillus terricola var. indicus]
MTTRTTTTTTPKTRSVPSCSICLFARRQMKSFVIKIQAKDDEMRRKLGYGRVEDGPDDNRVPDYYNLIPLGEKQTCKKWTFTRKDERGSSELTKIIDSKWRDFERNMSFRVPGNMLIPARTSIIFENAMNESRLKGVRGSSLISLTSKRIFSMPFNSNGKVLQVTGKVDHVIFSGNSKNLDVALVVLKARKRGKARIWTLLKVMAMIHHARKKENMNSEIYGIATDSTEWVFAHIDNKSRYSTWFLHWRFHGFEIVAHVMRILAYAAARAATSATVRASTAASSKPGTKIRSTGPAGCRVYCEEEVGLTSADREKLKQCRYQGKFVSQRLQSLRLRMFLKQRVNHGGQAGKHFLIIRITLERYSFSSSDGAAIHFSMHPQLDYRRPPAHHHRHHL